MIAYIEGEILAVAEDSLIVLAGGLGYQIAVALACFTQPPAPGGQIALYTQLQFNPQPQRGADALTLYGFEEPKSQQLFNLLLSVNGVGARTALAALNTCGYAGLINAIQMGDKQSLLRIPGVGKKAAERILLELRDKIGKLEPNMPPAAGAPQQPLAANSLTANVQRTAVLALTQLGYAQQTAEHYVAAAAPDLGADAALEEIITAALRLAAQE